MIIRQESKCTFTIRKKTRRDRDSLQPPRTVARQAPLHGILQARILEWVAFPFSRGSSQLRDRTQVSGVAGRFFTPEPPGKSPQEVC